MAAPRTGVGTVPPRKRDLPVSLRRTEILSHSATPASTTVLNLFQDQLSRRPPALWQKSHAVGGMVGALQHTMRDLEPKDRRHGSKRCFSSLKPSRSKHGQEEPT